MGRGTEFQRRNVLILSACQALFTCSQTIMIFLGGLVGLGLAPERYLATLPITCAVAGNAFATIPASFYMRRVGRRAGFMTGAGMGSFGALLAAGAIIIGNFWLFCTGAFVMGCYNAFCQYYRFAAADASEDAFKGRAISYVLAGGIVAAFAGPEIALISRDLVADIAYAGSFVAVSALALMALLALFFLRIHPLSAEERQGSGRPLALIARQPAFIVAVLSAVIAYAVMSLLMTATPLAMSIFAFAERDAGHVIAWHTLGMFAPSFVTGHLIMRFGLYKVMFAGTMALAASPIIAFSGIEFLNFWSSLVLLGIGWNFLFIGGTTLLSGLYTPSERAKVQAANDMLVFGSNATASLLSGALLNLYGWQTINWVSLPMTALAVAGIAWLALTTRVPRRTA